MTHLLRAGAAALAFFASAQAYAQHATTSSAPAGYAPETAPIVVGGQSTPLAGTITSATCTLDSTPAGAACTISAGKAVAGPFTPQLGRPVRLLLKGGAAFSAAVGTSVDGCATVNPLTALGLAISYSTSANEYVDLPPTTGSVCYCLVVTVASGTESFAVRQ